MSGLRLAYNTNGLAHHRLTDAIDLLADTGYAGIGLTLDVGHLDPFTATSADIEAVAGHLERRGLDCVIETGARYILDPRHKHRPSLLSAEGAERRVEFLERCIAVGRDLGAGVVSTWSGHAEPGSNSTANMDRLAESFAALAETAAGAGLVLGFEPEPGMFVETLAQWVELRDRVTHEALQLTLDLGHVLCEEGGDPAEAIRSHAGELVNVQVEDMKRGVHEHLPFGEGDLDLDAVVAALLEVGFDGLVGVELSRDSHRAHEMVPSAHAALEAAQARITP
ncbi:MAG: sugar phosphate isomerase/epimerase family protein [Planctomycetota bacterium]